MDVTDSPTVIGSLDRERITHLNQGNSPLLRLPAEIRNHIYSFVFTDQKVLVIPSPQQDRSHSASPHHRDYSGPVTLLHTSHQLNEEGNSLFLSMCIFDVSFHFNSMEMRNEVLETLDVARCSAIQSIMLDIDSVMGIARKLHVGDTLNTVYSRFGALRRLIARFEYTPLEDNENSVAKLMRIAFKKPELEVVYEINKKHLEFGDMELFHRAWKAYDFKLEFRQLASKISICNTCPQI